MAKEEAGYRLVVAAVAAVVAFGCGDRNPVDHGGSLVSDEGRIAFTRVSSFQTSGLEKADVYAIDVDGSREERLTDSPGLDAFPTWSPDGERVAFASDRDGGEWDIYVMDADGAHQRRLT